LHATSETIAIAANVAMSAFGFMGPPPAPGAVSGRIVRLNDQANYASRPESIGGASWPTERRPIGPPSSAHGQRSHTAGSPCGAGSRCAQWPGGDAEPGYPMHRLHSIFNIPGAIGMPAAAVISALVFRSDGRFGAAWQIASFWLGLATVASGPIVATRGDRRCQRAAAACCDMAGSRLGDGGIRQAVFSSPARLSDCMVPAARRLPNGTDWHETDWAHGWPAPPALGGTGRYRLDWPTRTPS